jgi:hypothetical protein
MQQLPHVIPAIQEVEIGKITVQGQPENKVSKTPNLKEKAGPGDPCLSSSSVGSLSRRIIVQANLGKKTRRPYLKNNKAKRSEGVAQVVKCLPCIPEALSSNLDTATNIQKNPLKIAIVPLLGK